MGGEWVDGRRRRWSCEVMKVYGTMSGWLDKIAERSGGTGGPWCRLGGRLGCYRRMNDEGRCVLGREPEVRR